MNEGVLSRKNYEKTVQAAGMKFSWKIQNGYLEGELQAPAKGWVALGINPTPNLVGSNLLMFFGDNQKHQASDRFIVGLGDHRSQEELGGESLITMSEFRQNTQGTRVRFRIPCQPEKGDKNHHEIKAGKEIYVHLAYSISDDIMHHSIARKMVKIQL